MSFVGSLMGAKSGNEGGAGLNYNAGRTDIVSPVDATQANDAYQQANSGINQQQGFVNALQAQNGISNQSQVFAQQQALANQLQSQANGTGGPSIAQTQLNTNTGQNVANQAALMAGQRGAGANSGLMARQIGQQGAATQQQAVGQGATLGAQEQWAAMQALQNQQGQMAGLANTQVGQQGNALNSLNQSAQGEQGKLLSSIGGQNNSNVAMQSNVNSNNAAISGVAAQGQQAMFGGLMSGLSGAAASGARGGLVKNHYDAGGPVEISAPSQAPSPEPAPAPTPVQAAPVAPAPAPAQAPLEGPDLYGATAPANPDVGSDIHDSVYGSNDVSGGNAPAVAPATIGPDSAAASLAKGMGGPDVANMMKSVGSLASMAAKGGMALPAARGPTVNGEMLASQGRQVPGKAAVAGDSYENDTVNARLSPGEMIIPRHITKGPNAPANAAKFVAAILAKNSMRKK